MREIMLLFAVACGALLLNSNLVAQNQDGQRNIQEESSDQSDRQDIRTSPKSAVAGKSQVKWPMRMAKSRPVPVIEAKLNGQGPFLFYLDTGASTTTLDTAFVKKMKLPSRGKTTIRGPGTGSGIEADIVSIDQLQIGDVDIRDFEAAAFDRAEFSVGEDLVGSIGLPVFGKLPFTMDYSNHQIILGGDSLPEADGKTILKCDFSGPVPFFEIQLGEESVSAAFDSGFAGLLLVGEESAEKLKFSSELKSIGKGRSVSGEIEIKGAPIDGSLKVGKHTTANPMLVIMPAVLTDREICVLGHAWGKDMSVTYDQKNKRVRFLKSDNAKKSGKTGKAIEPVALKEYVGKYGVRTVSQDEGKLVFRREGGPALGLNSLGDDTFEMVLPLGARSATPLPNVRFERDDDNYIKGFSFVRVNEVESYVEKNGN